MSDQLVMPNGRIVTANDVLQMQETNMKGWRLAQSRAIEIDTLRRQLAEADAKAATLERAAGILADAAERDRAKLALAEQDSKRLDWLSRAGDVYITMIQDAPGDGFIRVSHDIGSDGIGETLTAAIDAAIAAGEGDS